jgi:hypothetical protein
MEVWHVRRDESMLTLRRGRGKLGSLLRHHRQCCEVGPLLGSMLGKMLDTLSGLKQGTRCWARDLEIGLDVLTLGFSQRDQPTNKPPNNTNKP